MTDYAARNHWPTGSGRYGAFYRRKKGKKFVLHLSPEMRCACFQVDGYLITGTEKDKCDRLVLVDDNGFVAEIYVELKGVDVNHAVDQLEETLRDKLFQNTLSSEMWACIVSNSFPSHASRSKIEKAKCRFIKQYKCKLKTIKSMNPERLRRV